MDKNKDPWFVVVERANMKYTRRLKPYVVGPYPNEKDAKEDCDMECSIPYCLLTIDAKNKKYIADECYWTQIPPKNSIMIIIDDEYFEQQRRCLEESLNQEPYLDLLGNLHNPSKNSIHVIIPEKGELNDIQR